MRTRSINALLNGPNKRNLDEQMRIITLFSNQHGKLRRILNKYWHLLQIDFLVGQFVSDLPLLMYRCVTLIRDMMVQSEYRGKKRDVDIGAPLPVVPVCIADIWIQPKLLIGQMFYTTHCINCRTVGVVYMLTCQCVSFYIGKNQTSTVQAHLLGNHYSY